MKRLYQTGAVLILVLWFVALVTILVATLASEVRLSAKTVFYNKVNVQAWGDILKTLNLAEMELLIARMPVSPDDEEQKKPLSERRNPFYRFDGRILTLAYPAPDTVTVRIYDLAGKINLQFLSIQQMRDILEKRIGKDLEKLDALTDAWQDWLDSDDLKRMNGAEKDYYEKLKPPYEPRNSRLETVEELLLIKGFAEAFKGVELDTAFTVYGNTAGINPNVATREALLLLPGIDSTIADTIISMRREKDFKTHQDFSEFMTPEQLTLFLPWINFAYSSFYTIAVQTKSPEEIEKSAKSDEKNPQTEKPLEKPVTPPQNVGQQRAYMTTVQFRGFAQSPKTLVVNPHGMLPDTRNDVPVIKIDKKIRSSY